MSGKPRAPTYVNIGNQSLIEEKTAKQGAIQTKGTSNWDSHADSRMERNADSNVDGKACSRTGSNANRKAQSRTCRIASCWTGSKADSRKDSRADGNAGSKAGGTANNIYTNVRSRARCNADTKHSNVISTERSPIQHDTANMNSHYLNVSEIHSSVHPKLGIVGTNTSSEYTNEVQELTYKSNQSVYVNDSPEQSYVNVGSGSEVHIACRDNTDDVGYINTCYSKDNQNSHEITARPSACFADETIPKTPANVNKYVAMPRTIISKTVNELNIGTLDISDNETAGYDNFSVKHSRHTNVQSVAGTNRSGEQTRTSQSETYTHCTSESEDRFGSNDYVNSNVTVPAPHTFRDMLVAGDQNHGGGKTYLTSFRFLSHGYDNAVPKEDHLYDNTMSLKDFGYGDYGYDNAGGKRHNLHRVENNASRDTHIHVQVNSATAGEITTNSETIDSVHKIDNNINHRRDTYEVPKTKSVGIQTHRKGMPKLNASATRLKDK